MTRRVKRNDSARIDSHEQQNIYFYMQNEFFLSKGGDMAKKYHWCQTCQKKHTPEVWDWLHKVEWAELLVENIQTDLFCGEDRDAEKTSAGNPNGRGERENGSP